MKLLFRGRSFTVSDFFEGSQHAAGVGVLVGRGGECGDARVICFFSSAFFFIFLLPISSASDVGRFFN